MNKYAKDYQNMLNRIYMCCNDDLQDKDYKGIQELVERATPKKPHSPDRFRDFYCPTCGEIVLKDECCGNNDCRQCIDWRKK